MRFARPLPVATASLSCHCLPPVDNLPKRFLRAQMDSGFRPYTEEGDFTARAGNARSEFFKRLIQRRESQ